MDQQDERWEQFDAWRGQQEAQANWMYDHTIREFQYLSTQDSLETYLQIDPFLGREAVTLHMATMDICLEAMHTVLAHPMMALLDYLYLIMYSLVTFVVKQLWLVIA
ncbi:hypothetical protein Tco_0257309 [Tanacetum coccineum]